MRALVVAHFNKLFNKSAPETSLLALVAACINDTVLTLCLHKLNNNETDNKIYLTQAQTQHTVILTMASSTNPITRRSSTSTTGTSTSTSSSDMDSSRNRRRHKHVCFGDVHINEFPMILGDNPYCQGAPLQLDWTSTHSDTMNIDIYEYLHSKQSQLTAASSSSHHRPGTKKKKHKKKSFHMSDVKRELYLLSTGYSIHDIVEACEQGRKIRKDRYNSFHGKKWDRFRVVMESAKSKLMPHNNVVSAKTA